MIRILICFAVVHDTENVLKSDWENLTSQNPGIEHSNMIIDTYDESALEYALQCKEMASKVTCPIHLTALTVGQSLSATIYQNLFAVGVDRVVLLKEKAPVSFCPSRISRVIHKFTCDERFDAIFMGQQNSITCNGQTGIRLSNLLNVPLISYVNDVVFINNKFHVKTKKRLQYTRAVIEQPAIYCFFNAERSYLRMATLREKLKVQSREIDVFDVDKTFDQQENEINLISLSYNPVTRNCQFINGQNAGEKAQVLLSLFMKD